MKYISNNKVLASMVLVLALVFVVGFAGAPAAHAQYYSYSQPGYSYQYNNSYAYSAPAYYYYSPLSVSCYPSSTSINSGNSVVWNARVSGGSGAYSYYWSGTDGLVGYGSSVSMVYYNPGAKTATLSVSSGGQSQSVMCSNSVNVYNNTVYYNQAPVYYQTSPYYSALSVSCNSDTSIASVGTPISWIASVTGGNGIYNYSWSGTDGLVGYNQSISTTYEVPGLKTAVVTVYSNGQTISQSCPGLNVGGYNSSPFVISAANSNNSSLQIGCYADPSTITVDQPVTWNAEATGGAAPYAYSWTGSDGLTGSQSSIIKYYDASGSKSAIVTVTSADGKSGTHACTNVVTVSRAGSSYTAPVQTQTTPAASQPAAQPVNALPAAALFSLGSIPWGWVAVLIILVLFGTVIYLVFNRTKI